MNKDKTEELLPSGNSPKPQNNNKKNIIIISVIIVLLIAVGVLVYFIFFNSHYDPEEYKKNLDLGQKYLEEGNYDKAILAFNDAIKLNNKEPEAFNYLAQSAVLAEDYPVALDAYDNVIKLSEDKIQPTIGKAEVYVLQGNSSQAEELLTDLEKEYPDNQQIKYYLNSLEDGNDPNNIVNGGGIATDLNGNIYFISYYDNSSTANYIKSYTINKYEPETGKTSTLVESNGVAQPPARLFNLNIWADRLYYNEGEKIVSCNLYGNDRQVISVDSTLNYICDGKLYVTNSGGFLTNYYFYFTVLNLDGTIYQNYETGVHSAYDLNSSQWIVKDNKIYYFTLTNNSYDIKLFVYDTETKTNSELAKVSSYTNSDTYNGIYYADNTIYYSYYQDQVVYAYNLETKENKRLDFGNNAEFGFTVNSDYIFLGNSDSPAIQVLDRENLNLVQTINNSTYITDTNEHFPAQTILAIGLYLTPNSLNFNRTFDKPIERGYIYYNNFYNVDLSNWQGKLLYSGLSQGE